MKAKDIPRSIATAWRLNGIPPEGLGKGAEALEKPVLISLTSIPSRLPVVHSTIRSLLDQSVRPRLIVLWLNEALEGAIPEKLQRLCGDRFEIRFRPGTSAHRKLVFALEEFPDHAVVNCDDDHMYPRDWLERLYREYLSHPEEVVAHQCRRILYDDDGRPLGYRLWRGEKPGVSHPDTLAVGYGGTLYPPGALHPDVTDAALYMELAPRADDLWFKAMGVLQGTSTRRSTDPPRKPLPVLRSQKEALGSTNIWEDGNVEQWNRICRHYGIGPGGRV